MAEAVALINNKQLKTIETALDVSDCEAVEDWAAFVVDELGRIDFVINNIGATIIDNDKSISYDDFNWGMNINFLGVVHGSNAFLPYLLGRRQ